MVASTGVLYGQIRRSTWTGRTCATIVGGILCISAIVSARSLATTSPVAIPLIYFSMMVPAISLLAMLLWQSATQPAIRSNAPTGAVS